MASTFSSTWPGTGLVLDMDHILPEWPNMDSCDLGVGADGDIVNIMIYPLQGL